MSLNSWLCDWFDRDGKDNKGYVTVKDVVSDVGCISVVVWFVISFVYGGYIAYLIISRIYHGSPIVVTPIVAPFWEIPLGIFMIMSLIGVLVGGRYAITKIAAIRVAKCKT